MNRFVLVFMGFLFASSCITTKVTNEKKSFFNIKSLEDSIHNHFQSRVKKNKSIFLKGKVYISQQQGGSSFNVTINHYIDSLMWASISGPFGIELLRLKIDEDSVHIINHINKTFSIKPIFNFGSQYFLFSENYFFELQNIILATPVFVDTNYTYSTDEETVILNSEKYKYIISKSFRVIEAKLQLQPQLQIQYRFEDFEKNNGFPKKQTISLNQDVEITLNYSSVTFNKDFNTPFKIPLEYARKD